MVKLIVQIPCLNEAETLPATIADIPRDIEGVDCVEILIIDDGSSDGTADVARRCGAEHVLRNTNNKGLARSFRAGLDRCLQLGADIIVNTDGDNQYAGKDIATLVAPILAGRADIVIGDRRTHANAEYSAAKKFLQKFGSWVVRRLSDTDVPDAVSGFRAFSREAALQINVLSTFSYTIETIIQAGKKNLAITSVPVATNIVTRPSRLFTSIPKFIEQQLTTIIRIYAMYQPLRTFAYIGLILSVIGAIPIVRFVVLFLLGDGGGHLQSLIIGGVLIILGFVTFLIALLADLIGFNRKLSEETLEKVRRLELLLQEHDRDRDRSGGPT